MIALALRILIGVLLIAWGISLGGLFGGIVVLLGALIAISGAV